MTVAVLTYHSCNVTGPGYAENDHVALAEDLATLARLGARVVPLTEAVRAGLAGTGGLTVALTFDDGPVFDYEGFEHPDLGPQPGFRRVLADAAGRFPAPLHASAFVIASPQARAEMDRVDFGARDWWHDRWWAPATAGGVIAIESHSWDHNHPSLARTAHKANQRGRFDTIDTAAECEAEVRRASQYIERTAGRRPRFFAYPWGQSSAYLRETWLPEHARSLGLEAAFGTRAEPITPDSERWNLPRWVCGEDWRASDELAALLEAG